MIIVVLVLFIIFMVMSAVMYFVGNSNTIDSNWAIQTWQEITWNNLSGS